MIFKISVSLICMIWAIEITNLWHGLFLLNTSRQYGDDERDTVIASETFRDVAVFDGDLHVRTLYMTKTVQAVQCVTQCTVVVVEI